jgi:hypothetical protein
LSEACDYFLKDTSTAKTYVLECDFPTREVGHNKRLDDVKEGNVLDGDQRRAAEEHEVWDGMITTVSFFVGAAGDRPKAKKLLETGTKTMDRPEFIVRLGRTLLDNQKVFSRPLLNDVQLFRQFYDKAVQCSELSQKLLKESPSAEVQTMADNLKGELEAMEKKGGKS